MKLFIQQVDFVQAGINWTQSSALREAAEQLGDFDWQSELTPAAVAVAILALEDLRSRVELVLEAGMDDDEEDWLVNDLASIEISLDSLRRQS